MNHKSITILVLFILLPIFTLLAESKLDSSLVLLEQTIALSSQYTEHKILFIENIKEKVNKTPEVSEERYNLYRQLYGEYKPFICDSAILYINNCIHTAERLGDRYKEYDSKITLARLMGSTGMYNEGVEIIRSLNRSKVPDQLLPSYYECFGHIYGELSFYTQDREMSVKYREICNHYRDSINLVSAPSSEQLLILHEDGKRNWGDFQGALEINTQRLEKVTRYSHPYAEIMFGRSLTYRRMEDVEMQKYCLAESAIGDIRSAVKDHASLWTLANIMYSEGDIDRAYRYIRFSWEETSYYNARLRSMQSASILSLIDSTYQTKMQQQNKKLEAALAFIGVMVVLLIGALFYILRQMKRLSHSRLRLREANEKLQSFNEELTDVNLLLQSTNEELTESNQIKEEYIGRFLSLCSTYIDKIDSFRRMVKKSIKDNKTSELYKIVDSKDFTERELADFYNNFDSAFLQLFPDFVQKVNGLLKEDEQFIIKKNESLNSELRILALIRLGINDSSQIAEFLRYSVNTIYNYRSKVKNKAHDSREDFEKAIMKIK